MIFNYRTIKRVSFYKAAFNSISGQAVLADLKRFCRPMDPCIVVGSNGQTDTYATGLLAGKQEVFWRIAGHLNLDESQLIKLKESLDDE
jgi:hypothetical protein